MGRVFVGPVAGVLTDAIGWSQFFIFSTLMAVPGIIMLYKMKVQIQNLEAPKDFSGADD